MFLVPITETSSAFDLLKEKFRMMYDQKEWSLYSQNGDTFHLKLQAMMTLAELLDPGLQLSRGAGPCCHLDASHL